MKEMHLINDNELDKFEVRSISTLSGNDVPLLRGSYYDLGLIDLSLGEVDISSQFFHSYAKAIKALLEITNNLSNQGLHRGNIDYLKVLNVKSTIVLSLHVEHLENRQKSDVGLSSSCGCTNK